MLRRRKQQATPGSTVDKPDGQNDGETAEVPFWSRLSGEFSSELLVSVCALLFCANIALSCMIVFNIPIDSLKLESPCPTTPSFDQPNNAPFLTPIVNKTEVTHKHVVDEPTILTFPCDLENDALVQSALSRATSLSCKQRIIDTACRLQNGTLAAPLLHRNCGTSANDKKYNFIGCYSMTRSVNSHKPVLELRVNAGEQYNTPVLCADRCSQFGHQVAVLHLSKTCMCAITEETEFASDSIAKFQLPDQDCVCDANSCQQNAMALYWTGLGFRPKRVPEYESPSNYPPLQQQPADQPLTRIVFLLQINGRNVRQIRRLIKLIYRPYHYYYVHVDARQQYLYQDMLSIQQVLVSNSNATNIHVTNHRFATIWGGSSVLDMYLNAVKHMFTTLPWPEWDYVVNMSENCGMIGTMAELEVLLHKHRGENFINSDRFDRPNFLMKPSAQRTFVQCDNRMWQIGPSELPHGVAQDAGADWLILHRSFLQHVTFSTDPMVTELREHFKHILLPLEQYMHIIARNSIFCQNLLDSNLKSAYMDRPRACICRHKRIADWCGCSPLAYRADDFNSTTNPNSPLISPNREKQALIFARKLDSKIDQRAWAMAEGQGLFANKVTFQARGSPSPYHNLTSFNRFWLNEFNSEYDVDVKHQLDDGSHGFNPISHSLKHQFVSAVAHRTFSSTSLGDQLASVGIQCKVNVDTAPIQLHTFREHDEGTAVALAHYQLDCKRESNGEASFTFELETRVSRLWHGKPNANTPIQSSNGETFILISAEVNTNYDYGEQLFGNQIGIISQDDTPAVLYTFQRESKTSDQISTVPITTVWVQPNNVVYTALSKTIELNGAIVSSANYSIFTHSGPLQAGTWSVELWHGEERLDTVPFPVFPDSDLKLFDRIMKEHFEIQEHCVVQVLSKTGTDIVTAGQLIQSLSNIELQLCNKTEWSSHAPDPKSEIKAGVYDKLLQMIV